MLFSRLIGSVYILFAGTTLTHWGGIESPSYVMNGMEYSDGALEVPMEGMYHVYAQVFCDARQWCGHGIMVNNESVAITANNQATGGDRQSFYTGVDVYLYEFDEVTVVARNQGTAKYYFTKPRTIFGVIRRSG